MKLEQELLNLISLLLIPIDSIQDHGSRVELFLGKKEIGFVPYFIVNDVVHFETDDKVLNYLNWIYIFNENKNPIIAKIQENLDLEADDINIVILNFRRLQVENIYCRGVFSFFNCEFIDGEWNIVLGKQLINLS